MHGRQLPPFFAMLMLAFLLNAPAHGDDQWLTVNKDYSSQRYVDLDQINPENVKQLKEVCEAQLPVFCARKEDFRGG
jgi:hypothetical protein